MAESRINKFPGKRFPGRLSAVRDLPVTDYADASNACRIQPTSSASTSLGLVSFTL